MLNSTVKVKRRQVVGAAQEKHGPLLVLKELTVCGCWALQTPSRLGNIYGGFS